MMVKDTARTCMHYLSKEWRGELEEHQEKTIHSLVPQGKLWRSVKWITEKEKGGIMKAGDACSKTGKPVLYVLRSRHPDTHAPSATSLHAYPGRPPKLFAVGLTYDKVLRPCGASQGAQRQEAQTTPVCSIDWCTLGRGAVSSGWLLKSLRSGWKRRVPHQPHAACTWTAAWLTRKSFWDCCCRSGRDLEVDDGEVHSQGGGTRGEVDLWDGKTVWGYVGRKSRGVFTLCVSCGHSTPRRRTGDSSSLTLETGSMRRIERKCRGLSYLSGSEALLLP